jgi:CheY-like chemotaxis protein
MQEENRATELRNMIGNVAHDLKTPVASFMSGIDIMSHTIEDLEKCCQTQKMIASDHIQATLKPFIECFKNIRNTNNFMLMTINRCIDYTKASKGMKLKPKYETIDLVEALMLPIDCMKNIQERIKIEFLKLPKEICTHIITDKQWLQENMLCLLSNAVKYSTEGTVTISVSLEERMEEEEVVAEDKDLLGDERSGEGERVSADSESYLTKSVPFFRGSMTKISMKIYADGNNVESNATIDGSSTCSKSYPQSIRSENRRKDHAVLKFVRIEIADNGIGLSEEAMNNLFNPFQQAQKLAGGTGKYHILYLYDIHVYRIFFYVGLGLYSLAKRMDGIGGKYGVKRRKDDEKGSVFWFEIPYRPDETAVVHEHHVGVVDESTTNTKFPSLQLPIAPALPLIHNEAQQKKWTVLLVDDSVTIVKMISMMLTQKGHSVHSAVNGAIALSMLQQQYGIDGQTGYDVVLMDLQMPVMDGLEATRRWRQLESEYNNEESGEVIQEVDDLESESSQRIDPIYKSKSSASDMQNFLNAFPTFPLSISSSRSTFSVNRDKVYVRKEVHSNFVQLGEVEQERSTRESKQKRQRHQLIIGMSANSDHETMEDAFRAGVDDFIKKPFTMENFLAILRQRLLHSSSSTSDGFSTT